MAAADLNWLLATGGWAGNFLAGNWLPFVPGVKVSMSLPQGERGGKAIELAATGLGGSAAAAIVQYELIGPVPGLCFSRPQ
jgi:hypothetical protein